MFAGKPQVTFLLIKEKDERTTSRRLCLIQAFFDQMEMEGRSPNNTETYETLLSNKTYNAVAIILSLCHTDLDKILKYHEAHCKEIPVILFYNPGTQEQLKQVKEQYNIKYEIGKNDFTLDKIKSLYLKINSDRSFSGKKDSERFTFIQNLGKGASSVVDLYMDTKLNRRVAIKKIQVEGMKEIEQTKVQKEVDLMSSIKIPTAIQMYDFQAEGDRRYIYMEAADKGTLEEQIRQHSLKNKPFDEEEIFDYLIEILLALYSLNQKNIMHRDIKSENILLKEETFGNQKKIIAKLSDLGISRKVDGVVGSMTVCGTPYYIAPEIICNARIYDLNVDIWSLGIVLYELITLNKPWYNAELSTKDFFNLVLNKNYPPLPDSTSKELKYLVDIMLIKDPDRRANIKDLFCLDFVYNRANKMIQNNGWDTIPDFVFDEEIKKNVNVYYLNYELFSKEDEEVLANINKLTNLTVPSEYKASYFGKAVKDAFNGNDLILAFSDDKLSSEFESEEKQKELIKKGLTKKVLVPLSHTLGSDVQKFVDDFFNDPNSYYFQSKCCSFDPQNRTCDNNYLMETTSDINEDTNFLLFSEYILDLGIKVLSTDIHNAEYEISNEFIFDKKYLKFLAGVAYFQKCDPFKIPYDSNHNDRLAFFFNLYQIFGIHCAFNSILDLNKTKSALYGYFQNDVKLTYKFKDFSLNHLDLLHILFRGNKPIPGSYMRLVYSSDIKCKLLPDYNSVEGLFVAYKVNDSFYTIYNRKEVKAQIEDRILRLLPDIVSSEDENELSIDGEFKPYLKDFGENCTPDKPTEFLEYLSTILQKHRNYLESKPDKPEKMDYKTRFTKSELINLQFLDEFLINKVQKKEMSIKFTSEKEKESDCLAIA
ncbi:MAG: protein kinase [archaeon]|nr:protein kinase [archaeon]